MEDRTCCEPSVDGLCYHAGAPELRQERHESTFASHCLQPDHHKESWPHLLSMHFSKHVETILYEKHARMRNIHED